MHLTQQHLQRIRNASQEANELNAFIQYYVTKAITALKKDFPKGLPKPLDLYMDQKKLPASWRVQADVGRFWEKTLDAHMSLLAPTQISIPLTDKGRAAVISYKLLLPVWQQLPAALSALSEHAPSLEKDLTDLLYLAGQLETIKS